jgi:small GTP-binding protein
MIGKLRPRARILTDRQEELRERALGIIQELSQVISQFPAAEDDANLLRDAAERLRALFLLVIVGEFNSGKSALINALLGETVMPEGVTPTTSAIHVLRYGESPNEMIGADSIIEHTYPAPFLVDVNLVDTPGTNAIIREHEALSQEFVPRADLVLFVTSADRPFTESERQFMVEIRNWGKKIVVVLNKVDLLQSPEDVAKVMDFIRANAHRLLGLEPEIFPVSARKARRSQLTEDPVERDRLWEESQFAPFSRFVIESLDEETRVRLKLLSPLGIADRLTTRYRGIAADRLGTLERDIETIERIEQRIAAYRTEMEADFAGYLARIESIVHRFNDRADQFFEQTIRLGRVLDLLNRDRVQQEFKDQVVSDTERQIDDTVAELIDWMVGRDLQMWQAVTDFIDRRQLDRHQEEVIGEGPGQFHYDRQALLSSVSHRAGDIVDRYDPHHEGRLISDSVRSAVTQTALAEVGAVSVGAAVIAMATTATMDVTGILAALTIGGLGLLILPARKRHARSLLRKRSAELNQRLAEALQDQFHREIDRSIARVRNAVAPYASFVNGERDKLRRVNDALEGIDRDITELRRVVEG